MPVCNDNALLIYRKRCARTRGVSEERAAHVRAARLADRENLRRGLPALPVLGLHRLSCDLNGPEPLEYRRSAIDYEHHIDKQLRPIADAILPFIGESFRADLRPAARSLLTNARRRPAWRDMG